MFIHEWKPKITKKDYYMYKIGVVYVQTYVYSCSVIYYWWKYNMSDTLNQIYREGCRTANYIKTHFVWMHFQNF